ncbi:IS66 family transposase [Methylocaldum sp. SAD2]|jgi:transposase|uniref:IS66 family transposase n=1 Tax=Methylocaldum sp. GT1BB TaxID=3438963 RepID=UPI000A3289D8
MQALVSLPDPLPEHYDDLRQVALSLRAAYEAELKAKDLQIEVLKYQLIRLKRVHFGAAAERFDPNQLGLFEEDLEADLAAAEIRQAAADLGQPGTPARRRPKRQPLPAHLPRIEHRHDLADCTCGVCGQALTVIGEDIAEQLDVIPARFFVHRHIRPQYACRTCDTVTAAPLPAQPIDKGLPAPGLLAQVLVAKYADHVPLYRQAVIYARQGVFIPRSTQAGWVGACEVLLEPLVERLRDPILGESYLQADETRLPVLAPGTGKTRTGYLWVYRTGPWSPLQAVVFDYAQSRGQTWPKDFLEDFKGTLQIDGYAGYNGVLAREAIVEAGCWAYCRRAFFDVFKATRSPLAAEALRRIGRLYRIEAEARDLDPAARAQLRQERAAPLLADLKTWLEDVLLKLPPASGLAQAVGYTLGRWPALLVDLQDGRIHIDTNPVERRLRGVAVGRRNDLFAGSPSGGRRAALLYSLIETCKLNGVEPYAYLKDVLTRLPSLPARDLDDLLPWRWRPRL